MFLLKILRGIFGEERYTITDMMEDRAHGRQPPERIKSRIAELKPNRDYRPKDLQLNLEAMMLPPNHSDDWYFWGGRWFRIDEEIKHTLFLGTTGSGKSHQMLITMGHLAKSIRAGTGRRMMIFGAKEDALEALTGLKIPFTVLQLSNPDSPGWDIARDYQDIGKAEDLAALLIPDDGKGGGDRMWTDGARAIVAGVVRSFIHSHGQNWGFHDLIWAANADKKTLIKILSQCPANQAVINTVLNTAAEKTTDGLRIQVLTTTMRLFPFAAHCQHAKRQFSIQEFLERDEIVVIQPDLDAWEAIRPIIHAIFKRTSELLSLQPDGKSKTWVFLDEAPFLGKIPGILELATFCRSRGGTLFLATQTVEGLVKAYGKTEAETILGVLTKKALMKADTIESATWAARLFGSLETWEANESDTTSLASSSHSEAGKWTKRERLLDTDFLWLPPASRASGVTAYYIPDEAATAYRLNIPALVIDELRPPCATLPAIRSKPTAAYMLSPWNLESYLKFTTAYNAKQADYVLYRAAALATADVVKEIMKELLKVS